MAAVDPFAIRRILWRVMLAALGLSAVWAVFVVLIDATEAGQMVAHVLAAA